MSLKNVVIFIYSLKNDDARAMQLNDVSFAVNEGEWIAIVGHNGSGKSTLGEINEWLLFPQEGEVHVIYEEI